MSLLKSAMLGERVMESWLSPVTLDSWLVLDIQPIAMLHSIQQTQIDTCSVPGSPRPPQEADATGAVSALQEPPVQPRKVPARHLHVHLDLNPQSLHAPVNPTLTSSPKGKSLKELPRALNKICSVLFLKANYFIK